MFTHMIHIKTETHTSSGNEYELIIYQVRESSQYNIYISKSGNAVGDIFTATQEEVLDAKHTNTPDVISELISIAKDDIDRNEFNLY